MNRRPLVWLSGSLWTLTLLLTALNLLFLLLTRSTPNPSGYGSRGAEVLAAVAYLIGSSIGALIVSRRSGHMVGWIILVAGLLLSGGAFGSEYATYALLTKPASIPAGEFVGWAGSCAWEAGAWLVVTFLLLVFPDGRLPEAQGWRLLTSLATANLVVFLIAHALTPGLLSGDFSFIRNPFGIEAAGALLRPIHRVGWAPLVVNGLLSTFALVHRMRRARGQERQQLKWVAYAGALVVLALPLQSLSGEQGASLWLQSVMVVAALAIPVAVGIAILKYRLYDIDVIINRTLVYGALTASLGLAYALGIALFQQLLQPLTGSSSLAIASSTLGVAALFRPARAWIRGLIDRRFYRSKYDAAKTLEEFSSRLRDEVDLDTLTNELLKVVNQTVQPARVWLWVRDSEAE